MLWSTVYRAYYLIVFTFRRYPLTSVPNIIELIIFRSFCMKLGAKRIDEISGREASYIGQLVFLGEADAYRHYNTTCPIWQEICKRKRWSARSLEPREMTRVQEDTPSLLTRLSVFRNRRLLPLQHDLFSLGNHYLWIEKTKWKMFKAETNDLSSTKRSFQSADSSFLM